MSCKYQYDSAIGRFISMDLLLYITLNNIGKLKLMETNEKHIVNYFECVFDAVQLSVNQAPEPMRLPLKEILRDPSKLLNIKNFPNIIVRFIIV